MKRMKPAELKASHSSTKTLQARPITAAAVTYSHFQVRNFLFWVFYYNRFSSCLFKLRPPEHPVTPDWSVHTNLSQHL